MANGRRIGPDRHGTEPRRSGSGGFTLIELMVVIAIVGIMVALAVPSFSDSVAGARLSSESTNLQQDLKLARSTAITRGVTVGVCASTDRATCSGNAQDWRRGRLIYFVPTPAGQPKDDDLVRVTDVPGALEINATPQSASITFDRLGFAGIPGGAQAVRFDLKAAGGVLVPMRCVELNRAGKVTALTAPDTTGGC